jgi:hypothetical protein
MIKALTWTFVPIECSGDQVLWVARAIHKGALDEYVIEA